MSADNVTPISGNGKPPKESTCHRFHLEQPEDGPDNMRLIQALHGVCDAIEQLGDENGSSVAGELGTAAEILSLMLQERMNHK